MYIVMVLMRVKRRLVKRRHPDEGLPLSGSESVYSWYPWGGQGLHVDNCYAYAVGDHAIRRQNKSVPGNHSGMSSIFHTYRTCKGLAKRVISDNPKKIYRAEAEERCRKSYYKVMMFVAPTNMYHNSTGDFHFYKQHGVIKYKVKKGDTPEKIARFFKIPRSRLPKKLPAAGDNIKFRANVFSHKLGWATGPLLEDAAGKVIKDPRKANRKYGYNYTKYCCSFCVKNKGIDVNPPKNSKVRNNLMKFF
jgi:hypothetical protein